MTFEEAVDRLVSPSTWCEGADALVKIGGRDALLALIRAYEAPVEASKLCLLDAMEALGPVSAAARLVDDGDAEERRLGIHLMELFADESYLGQLQAATADADPRIRAQARRSLQAQYRTPAWEATVITLLRGDEDAQAMAADCLSGRKTKTAEAALASYLAAKH